MIQIRHVRAETHRKLKARAAAEGMSLSDYLRREIEKLATQPTLAEVLRRIAGRAPVRLDESPAEAVRAERESR